MKIINVNHLIDTTHDVDLMKECFATNHSLSKHRIPKILNRIKRGSEIRGIELIISNNFSSIMGLSLQDVLMSGAIGLECIYVWENERDRMHFLYDCTQVSCVMMDDVETWNDMVNFMIEVNSAHEL